MKASEFQELRSATRTNGARIAVAATHRRAAGRLFYQSIEVARSIENQATHFPRRIGQATHATHVNYASNWTVHSSRGPCFQITWLIRIIALRLRHWGPFYGSSVAVGNFIRVIACVIIRLGLRRISDRATGAVARSVIGLSLV